MPSFLQKLITMLMTFLAMLGIGKASPRPPVQQPDNIASYSVAQNKITFTLKSNPSTGFGWSFTQTGDCVALTSDRFEDGNRGNQAGAPGKQLYTFTAAKPGKTTVTFIYERPWEDRDPTYTYTAVISVDDDLQISLDAFQSK